MPETVTTATTVTPPTPITTVITARAGVPSSVTVDGIQTWPLPPWRIVLVRVLRVYLQSAVGFLGVLMSGALPAATSVVTGGSSADVAAVLPQQFTGMLFLALQMALAPSVMTLSQNALELLTRLDESRPQWRG